MQVYELGGSDPEIAVVGGVHGDEVCGPATIERFREEEHDLQKPVKLVIANEKALAENTRFIDTDLNRSFPGDTATESNEARLAAALAEELEGCLTLDLHSTQSYEAPFAVTPRLTRKTASLIQATGVTHAVDVSAFGGNSLADYCNGVVVECGITGSKEATENAYETMMNFLAAQGAINRTYTLQNPDLFRITDRVPKKHAYELQVRNFERVNAGQVYASGEHGSLTAEEPFYPVLMSENGYTDILGFRADRVGPLSQVIEEL